MSPRTGLLARGGFTALAISLGIALLLPAAVAAAPAQIRFELQLGSPGSCLGVFSAPSETLTIAWRGADGTLKAQDSIFSDGAVELCPTDDSSFVAPGDKINARVGSYTRKYVVPNLSLRVDRVAKVIEGTGPAGRTVIVSWSGGPFGDTVQSRGVRVGQDGSWSLARDIGGDTDVSVGWTSPNKDDLWVRGRSASLTVTLGKARFSGTAAPFTEVDIDVENGNSSQGDTTAGPDGSFSGAFRKANGNVDPIVPGDHISAPSVAADLDWIVPTIDIAADTATNVVSGRCEPTASYARLLVVHVFRTGILRGGIQGDSDDGTFEIDFDHPDTWEGNQLGGDPANVKHGDKIVVKCFQYTGDWAQAFYRVP